jgi:hypothetical protein
VLTPV